jgi:hypothetical protein
MTFLRKSHSQLSIDAAMEFACGADSVTDAVSTAKGRPTLHLNSCGLNLSQRVRTRYRGARAMANLPQERVLNDSDGFGRPRAAEQTSQSAKPP